MVKYLLSPNFILRGIEDIGNQQVVHRYRDYHILSDANAERDFLINETITYYLSKFSTAKTPAEVLQEIQTDVKSTSRELEDTCRTFFDFLCNRKVLVSENAVELEVKTQPLFTEGELIDQFCIKSVLSERQYTEIYLAVDTTNDQIVVLKLLNSKKTGDKEVYQQELFELEREYRMLKEVEHIAAVCKAFGCNKQHPNFVYLTLEYIEGRSLFRHIAGQKTLGKENALDVIQQVLNVFSLLHDSNFIHGDIHASNMLVEDNKRLRLVDMGLSRKVDFDATEILSFGGVDFYMPPERINVSSIHKHSKEPDLYSDVYQLGVLMYFILYDKIPFDGFTWEELAVNIKETEPVFAKKSFSNFIVPGNLVSIIKKCLEKNPVDRYRNASEILSDYENLVLKRKEQPVN